MDVAVVLLPADLEAGGLEVVRIEFEQQEVVAVGGVDGMVRRTAFAAAGHAKTARIEAEGGGLERVVAERGGHVVGADVHQLAGIAAGRKLQGRAAGVVAGRIPRVRGRGPGGRGQQRQRKAHPRNELTNRHWTPQDNQLPGKEAISGPYKPHCKINRLAGRLRRVVRIADV